MPSIAIPIRVDALHIRVGKSVCGSDFAFNQLPWIRNSDGMDMNADRPYLAEAIATFPFQDDNLYLYPGQHLHWALPKCLCMTKFGAAKPNEFPLVPNRWYVRRESQDTAIGIWPTKEWIVESDFLWDKQPIGNYTVIPLGQYDSKAYDGRNYTWMGRSVTLNDWLSESKAGYRYFSQLKDFSGYSSGLTALGWGSEVFDTFFPNSNSVFGMCDMDVLTQGKFVYTIIGWYSNDNDNYLKSLLDKLGDGQNGTIPLDDLKEKYGLDIPLNTKTDKVVLWGRFELDPYAKENKLDTTVCNIAVAPTPEEAFSAMMAGLQTSTPDDKDTLEDQLEAILMSDRLDATNIDIGATLRELRHEKGFSPVDAGWTWTIRYQRKEKQAEQVGSTNQADQTTDPPMPASWNSLLVKLNQAQAIYDQSLRELNGYGDRLYADWYRYMLCCYPPTGEPNNFPDQDKARLFIAQHSLADYQELKNRLGGDLSAPERSSSQTTKRYEGIVGDIVGEVKSVYNAILSEVNKVNEGIAPSGNTWVLERNTGARYWEPKPPAVVIAAPKNTLSLRSSERFGLRNAVTCKAFNHSIVPTSANSYATVANELNSLQWGYNCVGINVGGTSMLHPFRVDWEAEYFPVASRSNLTRRSRQYGTDFITYNYALNENEAEFDHASDLFGSDGVIKSASVYQGKAILSASPAIDFKEKIEEAKNKLPEGDLKAKLVSILGYLQTNDIVAITLGGFNDALLQQHNIARMRPADPMGFKEYRNFTKTISTALEAKGGKGPDPTLDFNPIRAGALKVNDLRLIDTFGRAVDLKPQKVYTPTHMTLYDQEGWIGLFPRFAHAARVNFRFIAQKPTIEGVLEDSNAHPDSSPIAGWVIPNFLDKSLLFFSPDGKHLGAINLLNRWVKNPNNTPTVATQNVIDWVTSLIRSNSIVNFIQSIAESLDNIYPEDKTASNALAIMVGRPMAIVKVSVGFQQLGLPAFDKSWSAFNQDLLIGKRQDHGYPNVQLPFRLGEYRQRNDGLVGFWEINNYGQITSNFFACDSISGNFTRKAGDGFSDLEKPIQDKMVQWFNKTMLNANKGINATGDLEGITIKKQDLIQSFRNEGGRIWEQLVEKGYLLEEKKTDGILHYADVETQTLSLADGKKQFLLLMDPFGEVNLSTGILPVKSIKLPIQYFSNALKQIELQFLTSPLITPRNSLQVSLPKENGYHWNWLQYNKQGDVRNSSRTWQDAWVSKERLDLAAKGLVFLNTPLEQTSLFEAMLEKKWLIPLRTDNRDIATVDYGRIKQEYASDHSADGKYKQLLKLLEASLETKDIIHHFNPQAEMPYLLEIREGWLSLFHDLND